LVDKESEAHKTGNQTEAAAYHRNNRGYFPTKVCKLTASPYQIWSYGLFHLRINMDCDICSCHRNVAED